jgi:methionyl-tRNA synthetase
VGCETFYTPDELDPHGECFEHPGKKLETVSETNYFFRLSKYQTQLIELISTDTLIIYPDTRKNEVLSFLKNPLQDISISRSNERAKNWGVPVPGDETQRMYVWFDALNIYQSGIGFGWNDENYKKWWPADVHVIGKGITRFHAVYWPAFLLSAKLAIPKSLFVHGYFTVNGQKMSKTLGNVIDPLSLIAKYGTDAVRYYFLREIPPFNDGDFSETRFKELYNADLANGLGNLVARVARLCEKVTVTAIEPKIITYSLDNFRFDEALATIWHQVRETDQYINETKPWSITNQPQLTEVLTKAVANIKGIAQALQPFLPETAAKIIAQFNQPKITATAPLFPRVL